MGSKKTKTTKKAKKAKTARQIGRDSTGHPISLQSKRVAGFDSSDPDTLAQRRGDGVKGSMGMDHDMARKAPRKRPAK